MSVDIWVEIFLLAVVLLLLGWILYSGGGLSRQRKLQEQVNSQREELRIMREANEALRSSLGMSEEGRLRRYQEVFQFVRDLESLRGAIAGSTVSRRMLFDKYNLEPGPELFARVLESRPGIELTIRRRLADEILVGEAGRVIMKSLDSGSTIDRAASNAGMPLVVARGQIKRLQILGYLDSRLKPTEAGRKAMD